MIYTTARKNAYDLFVCIRGDSFKGFDLIGQRKPPKGAVPENQGFSFGPACDTCFN